MTFGWTINCANVLVGKMIIAKLGANGKSTDVLEIYFDVFGNATDDPR
jgi:hypothetical protein